MRYRSLLLLAAVEVGLVILALLFTSSLLTFALLAPALVLESRPDFDAVASDLGKRGIKAQAPAVLVGKSGVKHEFAFAVLDEGKAKVVVDTELSVKEVDEMKVLKFYVKVFDISPARAVLCVCPTLGQRAKDLASEYGITVLEDEIPRKLIPKAADAVQKILQVGPSQNHRSEKK